MGHYRGFLYYDFDFQVGEWRGDGNAEWIKYFPS